MANKVDLTRPGPWRALFKQALKLTDHLATVIKEPTWTFGGGTVLMLRINHRHSKDIDLFVPDPQYLGYVNPRLGSLAEDITDKYTEAAEYIKLQLPTGEIDFVVGTPLTDKPWEWVEHEGRRIRVETNAEIIAKKMYYRGDLGKARDLLDLCAVAMNNPRDIAKAAPFMQRHGEKFIEQLKASAPYAKEDFAQIEVIAFRKSFDECLEMAERLLRKHVPFKAWA